MTKTARSAVVAAACLVASQAAAAPDAMVTLSKLWKVDAGTSVSAGPLAWFNSEANDNMTRGLEFNAQTGHLLVADRETTDVGAIYALDAASGAQVGSFNLSGVTGGIYFLNKVAVDESGRVFACNLATAAPASGAANYQNDFRVYMWPSEAAALSAAPSVAYSINATPVRWGDDMDVVGSGASTKILVGSRSTTGVLVLKDIENDGTFAPTILAPAGVAGPGNVAFDTDTDRFWYHQSLTGTTVDFPARYFNLGDGSSAGDPYPLTIGYSTGAIDVAQLNSKVIAVAPADALAGSADVRGYVYQTANPTQGPVFQTTGLEKQGGFAANGNGTGEVVIDKASSRIFFLVTNNSLSAWTLPANFSAASDWQLLR